MFIPSRLQNYIPSKQDILFARKATKGIIEHDFVFKKIPFKIVDVGGQRSQRKKWFLCFSGITSILFMASSSEYDQVCAFNTDTAEMFVGLTLDFWDYERITRDATFKVYTRLSLWCSEET